MMFKILFTGEHTNHDLGSHYEIHPLTSSVCYLSDGTNHVLFDTGSLAWQEKLLKELADLGVSPDDITHVCLTHFHLDHTANCILFKNAEIHASRSVVDHKTGHCKVFRDMHQNKLPCGIEVFPTPGHTPDHVSYFVTVEGIRYCVAGDAIREDTILEGGAPHYFDEERKREFKHSMQMIFEHSDVIIPGHFGVIEGSYKEKLQALITGI
jgi:glyoxylase-like metal-dependent hydrolase (beta-lactamase superfamily II)